MLTSAQYLGTITDHLTCFRGEILSRGKLNLTDIHVYAENFVRQLLNIAFDYKLLLLSGQQTNFPGIDLGDLVNGVAFQVTARADSQKINHILQQVIHHRLYERYPSVYVFVLTVKQANYAVRIDTLPYFNFNPKLHIIDMNDFIRILHGLDFEKIKAIHRLVRKELRYFVK